MRLVTSRTESEAKRDLALNGGYRTCESCKGAAVTRDRLTREVIDWCPRCLAQSMNGGRRAVTRGMRWTGVCNGKYIVIGVNGDEVLVSITRNKRTHRTTKSVEWVLDRYEERREA